MSTPAVKRFAALAFCLALTACGAPPPRETPAPPAAGEPSLYRSLSRGGAEVDAEGEDFVGLDGDGYGIVS